MRKSNRLYLAYMAGVAPVFVALVFACLLYAQFPHDWALLVFPLLLVLSVGLGYLFFQSVYKTGLVRFVSFLSLSQSAGYKQRRKKGYSKKKKK